MLGHETLSDNFRTLVIGNNRQQTALIDTDAFTDYLIKELNSPVAPRFDTDRADRWS